MAIAFMTAPPVAHQPMLVGTATLVLVLTPVRAPDGTLHTLRQEVPAGQTLAACLPKGPTWQQCAVNGAVIPPEQWATWPVKPGEEVWAFPRFSEGVSLASLLIYAAVSIAISVAATALTYALFPPQKPHMDGPEERTFSFSGIQTAIGPGNVVPIIYGRHRVGGQLLSAFVEPQLIVRATELGANPVQAITQPPTLNMLLALSEGPIEQVLTDTIQINGQPVQNFVLARLDTRLGTPDQTPMLEGNETRNTFADGRDLPYNINTDEQVVYTTTGPVQALIATVVFNEGLFHLNGKGEKEDNTIDISYRLRVHGAPDWGGWTRFPVAAQRLAPVRFGLRLDNLGMPDGAVHDIALNFGAVRHQDDLRSKWQPTLESVTEIQYGTQTYPNTALLFIQAVAVDTLQGALPNVTVEVRGRRVRVGTLSPVETWSDDPAWCVMDFLTHRRYGLSIPDAEIDLFGHATWSAYNQQVLAGETRHVFNYVLDRDGRAQAILMEMMGGSRTLLLKSGGLWSPRPTRDEAPVQLLSWTSCSNVRLTYTRDPDRINVMEARYANENQDFQQDVMTWPVIDNWPVDVRKASLDIRGVTKPSRIQRALQFELNRRRFENLTLEMDCSLDAVVLQVHDLFRFSHPLPGWGVSGRIMEGSTQATLHLDQPVTMTPGVAYHLYLKGIDDTTEARDVVNTGTTTTTVSVPLPFTVFPHPRDTVYAFGTASPEGALRLFRVTKMQRKSDTTVHLEAVIHNPSIYDEPEASPLPVITTLFNPLGPPPGLTYLRATELVRLQPSGASLHVVNLAWDVGPLGPGLAPYGGATILRRTVLSSALAGTFEAGAIDFGTLQDPNDANVNFTQLTQVRGHVLEFDDYTVISGVTYVYRVVPISARDVPNLQGAREAVIHVAGPNTVEFFPGSVGGLRLRGKAVGDLIWEGRDVHIQWDPVPDNGLFSTTFFVLDYLVQVWAPGQEYLMRSTTTTALEYTYTFEMNFEDQIRNGHPAARRDMEFWVWARTNTGRISLDPQHILVTNPPPDMSNILPDTTSLFEAAIISWDQYFEPRDFDHYELHLDTMTPPVAIYTDIAIGFHGQGTSFRKVFPQGLTAGVTYYTFVLPYDTFGAGIASQTATLTPVALTADKLDSTPPGPPTNLVLTQGRDVSSDGTIAPWIDASWTPPPDADVAGYEVHVTVDPSIVPTVYTPAKTQHTIRFAVPGHVTVHVKVLAYDAFHNLSPFTEEATLTTDGDTVPPLAPTGLTTVGSIKSVFLLWTPPPDLDYDYSEVWAATTNNRALATVAGTGKHSFVHDGLGANDTRWYWIRAVDTSRNASPFHPFDGGAGIPGTAGQLDTTYIANLAVDKLLSGTMQAFVSVGVGTGPGGQSNVYIDGINRAIVVLDDAGTPRAVLGRLGLLSTQYGLILWDQFGRVQWQFNTGATTDGISDAAITATKIAAAVIQATHLRTDTAVITVAAQIANAIIGDAHITNLAVNKVISGSMQSFWQMIGPGPGAIFLDGINQNIWLRDNNNVTRVWIGRYGPLPQHWSLILWDQFGNVQWNAEVGGATTPGIAPHAVTASLSGAVGPPLATLPGVEAELLAITFPQLNAGDTVWLVGKCFAAGAGDSSGVGSVGGALIFALRGTNLGGPLYDSVVANASAPATTPMLVQTLLTIPTTVVNQRYVLTGICQGSVNQAFVNLNIVALRLQR